MESFGVLLKRILCVILAAFGYIIFVGLMGDLGLLFATMVAITLWEFCQ